MKIVWSRRATRHLEAAYRYWTRESSEIAAGQMLERIFSVVELLESHPEIGRRGRVPGTPELVIAPTPFILAYRIRSRRIDIVALLHGARKWSEHF